MKSAKRPPNHAGKNKTWWSETECLFWIAYRGHRSSTLSNVCFRKMPAQKKSRVGELLLVQQFALAAMYEPLHMGESSRNTNSTILQSMAELASAIERGKIRRKGEDRLRSSDVRRLWPAMSGRGLGRRRNSAEDENLIIRMADEYANGGMKLGREKMLTKLGYHDDAAIDGRRYQPLARAAKRLARQNARARRLLSFLLTS